MSTKIQRGPEAVPNYNKQQEGVIERLPFEIVRVEPDREAINFDRGNSEEIAVVPLSVALSLIHMASRVDFGKIKRSLMQEIDDTLSIGELERLLVRESQWISTTKAITEYETFIAEQKLKSI